jgi:predicted house-cleaning noncanonical NTP pyrophosphatase (MazG superfamily)
MKTKTFKLNKTVRDKIVEDHISGGATVKHHKLSKAEKRSALLNKLIEEAKECLSSEDLLSELADMQEVIDQLAKDESLTKGQISAEQSKKRDKNGGFEKGDYISQETWPADHKWAKYYAADPKRFPEIKK